MKRLTLNGRDYNAKEFAEMSGSDWKRLAQNFHRLAAYPEDIVRVCRDNLSIIVPRITHDLNAWSDVQVIRAMDVAAAHINEVCQEGGRIFRDLHDAADRITARAS